MEHISVERTKASKEVSKQTNENSLSLVHTYVEKPLK